jgi:hypothetical protein
MKKLGYVLLGLMLGLFIYATSVNSTQLVSKLTVSENLSRGALDEDVRHTALNEIVNFRPTSDTVTTDVDNVYSARLTSGTTIDLTSLTNTLGDALDLTGERIVAIKFKNAATTGSNAINITQGASNPYPLWGSTYSLDLEPRQSVLYKADTMLVDVDASNLGIDYTLNGDTLDVILISAELYN